MAITIQIPQQTDTMSPLGALIVHFNSSSESVKRTFSKMLAEGIEKERRNRIALKVTTGINDIRAGKGVSRNESETTEQFFERLCTE